MSVSQCAATFGLCDMLARDLNIFPPGPGIRPKDESSMMGSDAVDVEGLSGPLSWRPFQRNFANPPSSFTKIPRQIGTFWPSTQKQNIHFRPVRFVAERGCLQ